MSGYVKPVKDAQLETKKSKINDAGQFQELNSVDGFESLDNIVDPDTVCGIGFFKPKWIQKYATPRNYLILYCCIGIVSGTYGSYLIGCMSTIEKRFAFKSKVSGTIMIVDEIMPLLLGTFIGYFGGRGHRPRMIGFGMMLNSVASFITAFPFFIYGPATHLTHFDKQDEERVLEICDSEFHSENCDPETLPPTMSAVLLLMLAGFLKGFGNLAYYAIGVTYMDDNNKKRNTPLYLGIAFSLRLFGPLLGYLMSSFFLKFHEDPFSDPEFGPDDPRWIGGWWMGFVLQGSLLILFAIPMSLFPRRMPGQQRLPSEEPNRDEKIGSLIMGLFAAGKRLAKNPLFVLLVLNDIMAIFATYGHYVMLPRYMEHQFQMSASDASLYSGTPAIGAFILSTVTGGFLIWKFKPSARFIIGGMITIDVIAMISFLLLMIPKCEHVQMTHSGHPGLEQEWILFENECNVGCNCSSTTFSPVCGPDGNSLYFSPCYAGCKSYENKSLSNCSCVSDTSGLQRDFVTEGFCVNKDCWSQALGYIIFLPVFQFLVHLDKVAEAIVMLRAVDPQDKSVAVGTFEALICAFALLPHPVFFGAITDSVCLLWEKSCGKTGNCWIYDAHQFNYLLHGACAAFTVLSALFMCGAYTQVGRMRGLYDDEDMDDPVNEDTDKNTKQESEL